MLIGLPFLLMGCAASIRSSNEPPVLSPAPSGLTASCASPVRLPDRELSQSEVEEYWLRDRQALIECGMTKEALLAYYRDRDSRITGED